MAVLWFWSHLKASERQTLWTELGEGQGVSLVSYETLQWHIGALAIDHRYGIKLYNASLTP